MPTAPRRSPSTAARRARSERVASTLDSVRRVIRALRVGARQAEQRSGLSPAQLFVLGHVAAEPNQSLTELAERTLTDRTSVAAMVTRLADRGLVRSVRGTGDRRRTEIRITAAGSRVLARAPNAPTQQLLDALEQLDDATLDRLSESLGALVGAMGVAEGPVTMLFEDAVPGARRGRRPAKNA